MPKELEAHFTRPQRLNSPRFFLPVFMLGEELGELGGSGSARAKGKEFPVQDLISGKLDTHFTRSQWLDSPFFLSIGCLLGEELIELGRSGSAWAKGKEFPMQVHILGLLDMYCTRSQRLDSPYFLSVSCYTEQRTLRTRQVKYHSGQRQSVPHASSDTRGARRTFYSVSIARLSLLYFYRLLCWAKNSKD